MSSFRELVNDPSAKAFMVGAELVTTRGHIYQVDSQEMLSLGLALADYDKIDWLSITDNAGGNPMLSADYIARQIHAKGKNVVIHLTCKDKNRNALESSAWKYASDGLNNILCLTGDYPVEGFHGIAGPVFDIDSTTLIRQLKEMNDGLRVPGRKPNTWVSLDTTDFFVGCAVSPFKDNEAETMGQYLKLRLKCRNGADFIITQVGYEMRKCHELKIFMASHGIDVPIFGNVYVLSKGAARAFNRQLIPGCVVSNELFEKVLRVSKGADKGRGFCFELAAKQCAVFRGLGYRGAYLGGLEKLEDYAKILEMAESFSKDDWKDFARELIWPQKDEFYLYSRDDATGLADPNGQNPSVKTTSKVAGNREVTFFYHINRIIHKLVFDDQAALFRLFGWLYGKLESRRRAFKFVEWVERMIKSALFDCRNCGDCSLPDCYYLCPLSQCAKNQRNGPCGGSKDTMCEVLDKKCIWYRAYHRAKRYGELEEYLDGELVIQKNELLGTSSWGNRFLGKDHFGRKGRCNGHGRPLE